ncbi:hypothetical protein GCM10010442_35890 [Kitasatospora kifunensis]
MVAAWEKSLTMKLTAEQLLASARQAAPASCAHAPPVSATDVGLLVLRPARKVRPRDTRGLPRSPGCRACRDRGAIRSAGVSALCVLGQSRP